MDKRRKLMISWITVASGYITFLWRTRPPGDGERHGDGAYAEHWR